MGGSQKYRSNIERAIEYSISIMNESGFWKAVREKGDSDVLTTFYHLCGLKYALLAGVKTNEIKHIYKRCNYFFDMCVQTTGDNFKGSYGWAWSRADSLTGAVLDVRKDGTQAQACAGNCRILMGWRRSEPWLLQAAEDQAFQDNNWKELDLTHLYLSHCLIFNRGGGAWQKWNRKVYLGIIPENQNTEKGVNFGSWNPGKGPERIGGRVMSTVFACLILEIYYRRSPELVID